MIERDTNERVEGRERVARSGGLRHQVAVPASVRTESGGKVDAEILDVSTTGMYLRVQIFINQGDTRTFPIGSTVTVSFAPDENEAPRETIHIPAEVVRRNPHGLGLHFELLDPDQRRALRNMAVRAVEARAHDTRSDAPSALGVNRHLVMSACRKVLERHMKNVTWTLHTEVARFVRAQAPAADRTAWQEAQAQADQIVDKSTAIGRTIDRRVMQSFAQIAGLDATQEIVLSQIKRQSAENEQTQAGESLDLVRDDVLAGSVALNDTCQRLQTALATRSFGVNVRVANVLGERIDEKPDNPLVPAALCRMMWESLTRYCDSPRVHAALRRTFVEHVLPMLFDLYAELDRELDAHEVPDLYWIERNGGGTPAQD